MFFFWCEYLYEQQSETYQHLVYTHDETQKMHIIVKAFISLFLFPFDRIKHNVNSSYSNNDIKVFVFR